MPNQSYFPASEADRVLWLTNLVAKLPIQGPNVGLSATEISDAVADSLCYIWIVKDWYGAHQQKALEATTYKTLIANGTGSDIVPLPASLVFNQAPAMRTPGVLTRISTLVQKIKLSPNYTDSIGQDLGTIGVQDNTVHLVPEFTVSTERGTDGERVKLTFTKYGHDGVSIECRRNDGSWEVIGVAMLKPWYDERPLLVANSPESREYRLRWWDKGTVSGELTPVQRVTVGV